MIAESSEEYYASLLASTHGWHEGAHDPWPSLTYFTGVVDRCCVLFGERTSSGAGAGSKRERVKRFALEQAPATFRIADVRVALPRISDGTIRNALDDLRS